MTVAVGASLTGSLMFTVDNATRGILENRVDVGSDEGDTDPTNNVATASATVDLQTASIAGTVFFDSNENGMLDADEDGIARVQMTLRGTDTVGNDVEQMVMTNSDGEYLFVGLPAGTYQLIQRQPIGWRDGQLESGSGGSATEEKNEFADFDLAVGTAAEGWNFGELRERLSLRRFLASYSG